MTKTLKQIVEATKLHPMALHVSPVKVDGKTKYQVKHVGKDLADGIKVGEHLTDSHLDDAAEMGAKIKHIKEAKSEKKGKHEALKAREPQMKQAGTDESVDHKARFMRALESHGICAEAKLESWNTKIDEALPSSIKAIAASKGAKQSSKDQDTDVIRDYDADIPSDVKKPSVSPSTYHHRKMKRFRVYHEELTTEAISARQALSKAADFEYKAANSNDPNTADSLKGKAKALRRAAAMASRVAGTVDLDITKK